MKLASGSARSSILVVILALALAAPARAETVETRSAVMVRDRAAVGGRVVDRVPAGQKLTIVETSNDGAWARVRTKAGHEGWVPTASLRSRDDNARGEDEELAKRRNVRPESWVSKSKYHEEDNKMTVVVGKAELFGRPQATGTVLGIVRRGEVVQFVRRSADKKWVQIDIGAGELAWVDAKAVRMGADMPSTEEAPPEEPRRPAAREERRDDPPPTPSRKPPRTEPSPEDLRKSDRARDDEPPPRAPDSPRRKAEDDKRRKAEEEDRRRADEEDRRRADEDRRRADEARRREADERRDDPEPPRRRRREVAEREADQAPRTPSRRPPKPPHGKNYVDARLRLGFARVGERVRTNGSSTALLRNYEHATTGLAIGAQLGYSRAIGKLRLHVDLKYLVVALGSVVYQQTATVATQLFVLDQNLGGGVAVGGFWDAAGGIDLRLRLGVDVWVNQISASNPPLSISSNILLGMAIGIEFAMPEPILIARRPLGFRIKAGAIAPATRMQQPNLKTAPENSTLGGYVGAAIHFGLLDTPKRGQLHLELGYDFAFHFSHFTGACPPTTADARVCRDDTVDDANYSSSAHIGSLGLYYQF